MRYRADIDGLRGIAVVSVLLFHLGSGSFSGGYVGVDVFFVISGFLITRLIRDEVQKTGTFSFSNFYMRRVRRLLPSLLFTLALSLVVAIVLFSPQYLQRFGGALISSVMSFSNFYFWMGSGYFDTASEFKPLLHTWSLSVEEQFYLVWPILLVLLLLKAPKLKIPVVLLVVGAGSLFLNHLFSSNEIAILLESHPTIASWFTEGALTIFYLAPFRVFEFAIGALIVWLIAYKPTNPLLLEPLVLIGLAMIAYPIFTYTEETLFPSVNALMPCIGAALLIYGGTAKYSGKLLSNKLAVSVGLISYSLYLIHLPIIVFYRYYKLDTLTVADQLGVSIVSLVAATLMYFFIERPFRIFPHTNTVISSKKVIYICTVTALLIIIPSASIWANKGWEWRKPNFLSLDEIKLMKWRRYNLYNNACQVLSLNSDKCNLSASLQVLVLGNSHHYVGYNALYSQYSGQRDINIISFGAINKCGFEISNGNLIATGLGSQHPFRCPDRAKMLRDRNFLDKIDVLVISSFRTFIREGELNILNYIKSKNKDIEIVIMGSYVGLDLFDCTEIINRYGSSEYCKDEKFVKYFGENDESEILYEFYALHDFLYIDIVDLLCEDGLLKNCKTEAYGVQMLIDKDHPSLELTYLIGKRMREVYREEFMRLGFN
jgi:peptidoglycan/LPS O-acetylase OafA/YrhL